MPEARADSGANAPASDAVASDAVTSDYVIVGAGSAGLALAARLTEDPTVTVTLLEAGGDDRKAEIHIPAAFSSLFRSAVDWNYDTAPQPALGGRTVYWPRGKVLGGSSSINAMMWVRGFAADYDGWADAAGPGWSYQALLPYFRRVESISGTSHPDHGTSGAVPIEKQRSPRSATGAFLRAAVEAGIPLADTNSASPYGVSETMVTQSRGARVSTVDAYLKPAKSRPNLRMITSAHVTRVLFEAKRATGVEYRHDGRMRTAHARREVVLCGGAVNTPQLLQLSGIGDPALLARHGVDVFVNSPEVGANLRDHLLSGLIIETHGDTLFSARSIPQVLDYLLRRRGMLTSNVAEAYGFIRTDPALALPDIELIFAPVAFANEGLTAPTSHALTLGAILLQPVSSGVIEIHTSDPFAAPLIDPRYLSDPGGLDRATLTAGLGVVDRILQTREMRAITSPHYLMPEGTDDLSVDERISLAIDRHAQTLYHPVGTARMGTDAGSVVDPELRVRGVDGLRVADASVMPGIIRGHTNAPSIVIGEKAADLLRGR